MISLFTNAINVKVLGEKKINDTICCQIRTLPLPQEFPGQHTLTTIVLHLISASIALYCSIVLYCSAALYYTVLILYCTLYCTVTVLTVLYCTVLYIVLTVLY